MSVTKRELARRVAERAAMPQAQTLELVQLTLEAISEALLEERRLELRGFGIFEIKTRAARKARDPRTKTTMDVPPRNTVSFRASQSLKDALAELPLEP